MKRLSIDLDDTVHKEIKIRAAVINCSMREWIIQAMVEKIAREDMVRITNQ